MSSHLLDELVTGLGTFSVFDPRAVAVRGFCLSFYDPLFEPRRTQIADSITRVSSSGDMVVGLAFWDHPRFLNRTQALTLLAEHGVGRAHGWNVRTLSSDEPDTPPCHFASQDVDLSAEAVRALSEMVTRGDHGSWQGVSALLYLWNRRARVLVRYWDDRGADVLCPDPLQLAACAQWLDSFVDLDLTAIVWNSRRIQ